jgi:hypothetical protein
MNKSFVIRIENENGTIFEKKVFKDTTPAKNMPENFSPMTLVVWADVVIQNGKNVKDRWKDPNGKIDWSTI